MKQLLYKAYEFFLARKNNKPQWKCSHTTRVDVILSNFETLLSSEGLSAESVGIDWLFRYMSFQFARYESDHLTPPTKIFGKKAYSKWKTRPSYWEVYATRRIYQLYAITLQEFTTYCTDAKTQYIRNESEDVYKELDYGTDAGLASCIRYTTLYNHKNRLCFTCPNQTECKQLLQSILPHIYKQRKYDK